MAINQLKEVVQTLRSAALFHDEASLTDAQLLERYVRSREESAFAALVHRHGPMVRGVCQRVLRAHHDVEDAFQATFLVLVRKASSIVPRGMIVNWLYGVAHRTALKARATAAKRGMRERQVTAMPDPAPMQPGHWEDLQPVLDQELSRLPDKYRAVIVLCDLEGKTRKEAAQHFKLPEGTVASRLATARTMLAKRLTRAGLTASGATLAAVFAQNAACAGLPASVASTTVQAATLFAAGSAAAGGALSVKAVLLAERVLKSMLLAKLKIATALLAMVGVLGVGATVLNQQVAAEKLSDPSVVVRKAHDQKNNEEGVFWPQWRGPNRDGVVRGVKVPTKWPKKLTEEWGVPVGAGVASPVVFGRNVYVFTRQNEAEMVLCLNLQTGSEVWRSEPYRAPYKRGPMEGNFSMGPRSTPALVGERVYTLGLGGVLSCLDARTGTLLWRNACQARPLPERPGISSHNYGGTSPLVADGLCIVHAGDGEIGGLTAFDALTGDLKWCFSDGYLPMSGSPIIVDLAGERQVVTYSSSNATGVSLATGRQLWRVGTEGFGQPHTTPVQYKDLLILNDILQPLRALRLEKGDKGITAREVWKAKGLPLACCSPVIAGDLVFGMSSRQNGCFFCLDATSGTTLWESDGGQGGHASILNAGSVLLILAEKGRLFVVKPSATAFEPIAEYQVSDSETYAHPVLLGERFLIRDGTTLRSFRIDPDADP